MKDDLILGRVNHFVPHTGFPYSRDFASHIKCDNSACICHGSDGCAVPSNCEIDNTGRCKWYLKQLETKAKE